jgi:alpha-L-fucosidase
MGGPRWRAMLPALLAAVGVTVLAARDQQWPEAHPPVGQQPRRPAGYEPFRYPGTTQALWRDETPALLARGRAAWAAMSETLARGPYAATHESLAAHAVPEWFLDAKFGMFIDWGPWSVAGWAPQTEKATYPDWYEQRLFKEYRDYHVRTWGADIGPDDLIQLLRGDDFRADRFVDLARAAGMRYVVPFLKHHGGYALWDSSFTHRDSVEWGLRRDVAGELSGALHRAGLRFGAYVSLGEWAYPVIVDGQLRSVSLSGKVGPLDGSTPFLSGKVPVEDYARDYLAPSIKELIDQTDPDLLWFDGEWEAPPETWQSAALAAYFYDRARRVGQDVAVNDRLGKDTRGVAGWGDFFTSEYHVIEGFQPHAWEENRSLSHSYGYNWEESFDDRFVLDEGASLDLLLGTVANGGNLLLMVSPDGSGRVPPNQERRLRFLGAWLQAYGEAIYATRPIGLTRQPAWGYVTRSKDGRRLFCIIRRWPSDGQLLVPVRATVRAGNELHGAATVRWSATQGALALDLGDARPTDPDASVVVLDVEPGTIAPAE